jgi:hypothetical protein
MFLLDSVCIADAWRLGYAARDAELRSKGPAPAPPESARASLAGEGEKP